MCSSRRTAASAFSSAAAPISATPTTTSSSSSTSCVRPWRRRNRCDDSKKSHRASRRTINREGIMARITRRRLLKLAGAGAVAAQPGGLAAVLATGRAPAFGQGTTIHWLRWADFVPASDVLLKGKITQECQKALGVTLKVETINANDLQARITSAIQSGTGPDIILALNVWPQLSAE